MKNTLSKKIKLWYLRLLNFLIYSDDPAVDIQKKISIFPKKKFYFRYKKSLSQDHFLYFSNALSYCFTVISHEKRLK